MLADNQVETKRHFAPGYSAPDGGKEADPAGPGSPSRGLAPTLDTTGHALLVLLPVVMVVANRSSPLLLSCAAVCITAARLVIGHSGWFVQAWPRPTGLLVAALAYPLLSLGWTLQPAAAAHNLGEAFLPLLAGTALVLSWRVVPPPPWLIPALAWAMLLAAGLIGLELLLDLPLRQLYGGRLGGYAYNRPAVTLLLLLWPVLALLSRRTWLGLLLLLVVGAAILVSDSEAAKLGLLVAAGTFVLVSAGRAWAPRLCAVVLLALVWTQPVFGDLAPRLIPAPVLEAVQGGHARERLEIWQAFGAVARRHFVWGTGFASSPHLSRHPVAAELTAADRRALDWGHPHNAYLQAWVELGLPGALLLSWLIASVLGRLGKLPTAPQRVGFAVVMAISAIALVSHGAWQGWWISAVMLAAALLTLSARNSKDAGEDPTESCSGLQQ